MMDPYERLANAIIKQAVLDYKTASAGHRVSKEVEEFILSPWFTILTDLDPRWFLEKLKKEAG